MRVLFTSIRNIGHFQPLVPLIEACLASGHEVGVSTPPDLEERARKTGARFLPFGHPGDAGLAPLWKEMRQMPPHQQGSFVVGQIFAGACAEAAIPGLLANVEAFAPDVLVREAQEYAGLVVGERCRIPTARVGISLETPGLGLLDTVPALARHRTALQLEPDGAGRFLTSEPVITQFPRSLWPDSVDQPLFRFRALDQQEKRPLLHAWPGPERAPLVYVTLGTVAGSMKELEGAYRLVLAAVGSLPVRALLTTGDAIDPQSLAPIPANIRVERFVPQAEVLPHVQAVLCHGGSGTVLGALAAGVPLVVLPLFADQPQNAARVQAIGAGLSIPHEVATQATLADALARVLEEPGYRERALGLAEEIATLPPVSDVPAWLEGLISTAPGGE